MRRGTIVALALAVSAAVGCTDPKAGTLPSATPAPTVAPTTATPSTITSDDLRASLRTALRTYFDALYTAGLDPANKTDELAALIAPSCTCYRVVDVLRDQARRRRHVDYRYTLRTVTVIDVGPRGGNIRYVVSQTAGALRDSSGRAVERYPASTGTYTAHFARDDQRWLLDRLEEYQ